MSLREPLRQFLILSSFYLESHWEPLRRLNIAIYIIEKSKKVSPGAITPLSPTLLIFFQSPPGSYYASFSYSFNIVIYIREKAKCPSGSHYTTVSYSPQFIQSPTGSHYTVLI